MLGRGATLVLLVRSIPAPAPDTEVRNTDVPPLLELATVPAADIPKENRDVATCLD